MPLPDECYCLLPGVEDDDGFIPCGDFRYSQDGRYLSFRSGPTNCGRTIQILDTVTGKNVFRSGPSNGLGVEWLASGKALISTGHCESGGVSVFDPDSGDMRPLGGMGRNTWNAARTGLAVTNLVYRGLESAVWGYNAQLDFLFLPQTSQWDRDDHTVWTPDGSHLLYTHRTLTTTMVGGGEFTYTFPDPRQIVRVDAATGAAVVLVHDPAYNYHFCAGAYNWCEEWHGDWVQVRRTPFEVQTLPFDDDFYRTSEGTCLLYGIDCREGPELFALNWRTGEVVPWEEAGL